MRKYKTGSHPKSTAQSIAQRTINQPAWKKMINDTLRENFRRQINSVLIQTDLFKYAIKNCFEKQSQFQIRPYYGYRVNENRQGYPGTDPAAQPPGL
jgi:hypothetical protein